MGSHILIKHARKISPAYSEKKQGFVTIVDDSIKYPLLIVTLFSHYVHWVNLHSLYKAYHYLRA